MKLGISVAFGDGENPLSSGEEKIVRCPRKGQRCHPPRKVGRFSRKAFEEITVVQTFVTAGALRRFLVDTPAESPGLSRGSDQ